MKIITIDFDHTLEFEIGGANKETLKILEFWRNEEECKFFIVTSRNLSPESLEQIQGFVTEHDLEIVDIIHTNGESKIQFIKDLGSSLHLDDCMFEIQDIKKFTDIETISCFNWNKWDEFMDSL